MKIEHPHVNVEPASRVTAEPGHPSVRPGSAQAADEVRLSSDLRLADEAIRAAAPDEGRSDEVQRARALFEGGAVGTDLERLADRMIESLLHSYDDR
jgi:hypothetical protein